MSDPATDYKRPECEGCQWWTVQTGKFLHYEEPEGRFVDEVLAKLYEQA